VSTHRTKTIQGIIWSTLTAFSRTPISILTNIILFRLLGPTIIGLMGMLGTVLNFLDYVTELGIGVGIVRTKDLTREQINDLFLLNFYISLAFSGVLILVAPLIASFFNEPQLSIYYKIVAVVPLLRAFTFTSHALLTRELEFKKLALATWIPNISGNLATVALVFIIGGLDALVAGYILSMLLRSAMLLIMARWVPSSLRLSYARIRDVVNFSIFIYLEKMLHYATRNVDRIFIGHFLGAEAFGLFEAAKRIVLYLHGNVSRPIARVIFPSLAKLQDDLPRMKRGYLEVVRYMTLLTFPALLGMTAVAPDLFVLFFGDAWRPSIIIFQILCIAATVQSVETLTGSVFYSLGRSKLTFVYVAILTALYLVCYWITWRFGLLGIAFGTAGVLMVVYPFVQRLINRSLNISWGEFYASFRVQAFSSLMMFVMVIISRRLLSGVLAPESVGILLLQIAVGAAGFTGLVWILDRNLVHSLLDILRMLKNSRSSREGVTPAP
jgi:lipopolysaccharide exporter